LEDLIRLRLLEIESFPCLENIQSSWIFNGHSVLPYYACLQISHRVSSTKSSRLRDWESHVDVVTQSCMQCGQQNARAANVGTKRSYTPGNDRCEVNCVVCKTYFHTSEGPDAKRMLLRGSSFIRANTCSLCKVQVRIRGGLSFQQIHHHINELGF